jgi:probable F420-dependent oxidoreductase
VDFGVLLPTNISGHTGKDVREFSQRAEALGFDSLWVGDHVAIPSGAQSVYPYLGEMAETGFSPAPPPPPDGALRSSGLADPLTALTFAAACTERIKVGTTVLILPMRNPVITAHTVASLDVLSGGRVLLGVGIGWNREEYATLGATFERRGARFDEYLEIMRRLWTLDDATYDGEVYSIGAVNMYPKPVQKPYPQYWFGGNEEPTLQRVVNYDGVWHFGFIGAEQLKPRIERLHEIAEGAGKDPNTFPITGLRIDLMERTSEEARREIKELEAVGVSQVVVGIPFELGDFYRRMEVFSREVIHANRGD